ncbi:beta-lactamase/transpeptidase-like protein [Mycena belliarum]|uniref:Beta-lactamase/transpeptidase-like protein n=1 Tax=Mycena belliarum TaxID=1033014 RepID=A0AAD6UD05_9AGAR|nr:beta-lactamase/transpeptidase-like protein [Mycena belliae]
MVAYLPTIFGLLSVALASYYSGYWPARLPRFARHSAASHSVHCLPYLPNIFAEHPPPPSHPDIAAASRQLGDYLSGRFAVGDIDSLSVAVVSSDGVLFEGNYGVVKGNESESSPPTTSDSSYRLTSVGKLFNVLEGHILAEKGVLSWEDPVEKYISFTQNSGSLTSLRESMESKTGPFTLSQLAAHMTGLGRDWPPGNVANWPHDLKGAGPPPTNGLPFPQNAALLAAIAENPLIAPPFTWPIYSNTGTGLLGLAFLEADRAARNASIPLSYAALLQRDIFAPLGMHGSHFLASAANKARVVVPALAPEVADQDFLDAMNPAAGQFSSLRDCATVLQTLLNPAHPKSLLSKATVDKWLRPVHSFEEDDWTEMGLIWEIVKVPDSHNRLRRIYWKLGAMAGYHTALGIHPGTSFGVVVLLAGRFFDAAELAYRAFEIFQPAIDRALAAAAAARYAGEWAAPGGNSTASIAVVRGTLYIDRLILDGVDALAAFRPSGRVALRWMHEHEEFRLDIGLPYYNGKRHMGCYPYWAGLDVWGMRSGAALNAIFFSGNGSARRLHVPALGVEMARLGAS